MLNRLPVWAEKGKKEEAFPPDCSVFGSIGARQVARWRIGYALPPSMQKPAKLAGKRISSMETDGENL
jgi:hypothetical protein